MEWQPRYFRRFEQCVATSTGPALVVTDAGQAYIKAVGNPEGPHVLACEWIAGSLAQWLGLRTLDFAVFRVETEDRIPLGHGRTAEGGPVFATRLERGHPWGGTREELTHVTNSGDLSRLIVFDTWIRNRDRYVAGVRRHVDNVFLSAEHTCGAERELVAMDHTHCLANGTELTPRLADIAYVRDETVFGGFPEFGPFWDRRSAADALARLAAFTNADATAIVAGVPFEWQVTRPALDAVARFLAERARWLSRRDLDDFRPRPDF